MINLFHGNAIHAQNYFANKSVDLGIFDPPFGINESGFDKHYKRDKNIIAGYIEAPEDYLYFTQQWLSSILTLMKKNSSIYIISGWTNLEYVLTAARLIGLPLVNHIIWRYNFGVFTKKKYVSAHYHILYYTLGKPTFNTYARYTQFDKNEGKSTLYNDLEDVWNINKDYKPGEVKNVNKLPDALIQKIIQYSSNPGDVVLDVFQGNFTTAINSLLLGRQAWGLELNEASYNIGMSKIKDLEIGSLLTTNTRLTHPTNQGKPLTFQQRQEIKTLVMSLRKNGDTKKQAIIKAMEQYQRGYFSILNIVNEE